MSSRKVLPRSAPILQRVLVIRLYPEYSRIVLHRSTVAAKLGEAVRPVVEESKRWWRDLDGQRVVSYCFLHAMQLPHAVPMTAQCLCVGRCNCQNPAVEHA
jgi:hypothetical protein